MMLKSALLILFPQIDIDTKYVYANMLFANIYFAPVHVEHTFK